MNEKYSIRKHLAPVLSVPRPVVLTIAGSDSGGGAGIQADLKVFALHRGFGATALTALTAQNTRGVAAVRPVPASFVRAQLACVLEDLPVAAVKTGMLGSAANVHEIVRALTGRGIPLVVDPVLASGDGKALLSHAGLRAVRERLLPLATLVTPNLDEAERLLGHPVRTRAAMRAAGVKLRALGAGAALVKGGHLRGAPADVLVDAEGVLEIEHPRFAGRTHGTGCVLSALIAVRLAQGATLRAAVAFSVGEMVEILARLAPLGGGRMPADPLLLLEPER